MTPSTVGVVGGGALGVTAAADLAARGVDVTLFERDDLASGSTCPAAGVCYGVFADPTANESTNRHTGKRSRVC